MPGSPGGVEIGRVSIKILPDTTGFVPELEKFVKKVEHQLKIDIPVNLDLVGAEEELRVGLKEMQGMADAGKVHIDVEVDAGGALQHLDIALAAMQGTADLNKIHVDVEVDGGAEAATRALESAGSSAGESMGRIGQQIALWGPLIFIAAAGIAGLAPALAVVFPFFAGIAAGAAVIALGFKQLKVAFGPIIKGFKDMRVAIGNALTAGLGPIIQSLTTKFMPAIKVALTGFATFVNGALKGLLGFINGGNGLPLIAQLFAGLGPALQPFARLLPAVLSVFLRLSVAALPALKIMGDALVSVTLQFDNLLKSGSTAGVITTAMNQLGQVLLVLGRLTAAILPTLLSALPTVINFLIGLGHGFGVVFGAAKPVFDFLAKHATTVQAIGASIGTLAIVLGVAAGAFFVLNAVMGANPLVLFVGGLAALAVGMKYAYDNSAKFRDVVDKIGAKIQSVVKTFIGWKNVLIPIGVVLGAALVPVLTVMAVQMIVGAAATATYTVALFAYQVATKAAAAGQFLLNAVMDANPILLVVTAIAALAAGLIYAYTHSETFRNIVNSIGSTLKSVFGPAIQFVIDHFKLLAVAFLLPMAPAIFLVGFLVKNFATVKTVVVAVFNAIAAAAKFVWPAISLLIQVNIAIIMAAFNILKTIPAIVVAIWNYTKGVFSVAMAIITGLVKVNIAIITGAFHLLSAIGAIVSAAFGVVRGIVAAVMGGIAAVVRGAVGVVVGAVRGVAAIAGIFRSAFNAARSAVSTAISGILSTVRGIPGRIRGALTFDLSGAGRALMNSFAAGIKAAGQAAYNAAKSIANRIKGLLPGSPIKWGPLTSWNNGGAGKRLMVLLGTGIASQESFVVSQVRSVTQAMNTELDKFQPGDLAAGFSNGQAASFTSQIGAIVDNTNPLDSVQQIQLNWETGRGVMTQIASQEAASKEFTATVANRMGVPA